MTLPRSAEDRPDPADQHAVHARVPDHVSRGVFSTGVIVMTAPTEFVIDFIQNLGRPHQVVARVVMPHPVLPQFVDALLKNIELYRARYGNLPQPNLNSVLVTHASGPVAAQSGSAAHAPAKAPQQSASHPLAGIEPNSGEPSATEQADKHLHSENASAPREQPASGGAASGASFVGAGLGGVGEPAGTESPIGSGHVAGAAGHGAGGTHAAGSAHAGSPPPVHQRRATAQEIYDDLKLRDDIHSGCYANAVMIGHGPHEFSFDFITNFYPQSAVSARVFLAAGQVARLAESLRGAWDQMRHRFQPPPDA